MAVPVEFTSEWIEQRSAGVSMEHASFLTGREPYRSMHEANPWLKPPKRDEELEWGSGRYYDTTVGRKHEYWRDFDLPEPTKDISKLRADFQQWGYCMIEDGMSQEQCAAMRERLVEQAEAERIAGVANMTPFFQLVWTLVNKGACFAGCVEHDPAAVQAGPLIERLVDEALGAGWYSYSFAANISFPNCRPQVLHQDQGSIHPWQTPEAPVLVNTMYIMQDVDEVNGGTLIIPGSHRILSEVGSGRPVGKLPPAINVEAPGGAIMVFDGRMLHGTGINHSDQWRYVMTQSNVKPWLRQQENWMLSVAPEVLAEASPKLLQRMGFQATATYGLTEGHGIAGSGRQGDQRGDLRGFRRAIDEGRYRRIGVMTPEMAEGLDESHFTLQEVQADYRRAREHDGDDEQPG